MTAFKLGKAYVLMRKIFLKILILFFFAIAISFFVNILGWFVVSRTKLPRTIRHLGFFRYFTNSPYTNFGYKMVLRWVFRKSSQEVRSMMRPYPIDAYIYRGRNYKGEYLYGLVGRYIFSYQDGGDEGSGYPSKLFIGVETSGGKKYLFWYVPSGGSTYWVGVDDRDLTSASSREKVKGKGNNDGDVVRLVPDPTVGSPDKIYWEGELVLVKFWSNKELEQIRQEGGGVYELVASAGYGYDKK